MAITLSDLHDATLLAIHMDWTTRSCELDFAGAPSIGEPFSLRFLEVTQLSVPAETPWGKSASVLSAVEQQPGRFEITMQSGDVISVAAPNYSIKGNINRTD